MTTKLECDRCKKQINAGAASSIRNKYSKFLLDRSDGPNISKDLCGNCTNAIELWMLSSPSDEKP